ncbi:hypothetical protein [Streptomyces chartreusis]|uniref:hypothetical protein n=1 Tax=Streptomyces chartreusis TaxID=1969 RepID=UPI00339DF524
MTAVVPAQSRTEPAGTDNDWQRLDRPAALEVQREQHEVERAPPRLRPQRHIRPDGENGKAAADGASAESTVSAYAAQPLVMR